MLKELRRLARQGVVLSDRGLSDAGRRDLVGAVRDYFGSIVRARAIAGVPDPPRPSGKREKWDEARVVTEILERYEEALPLAKSRAPQRLIRAGQRYFGSWREAIEAAGLDYDEVRLVREPYTADEVVEHLKLLAITQPTMTWAEVSDEKYYPAIARLFGSLDKALAQAGLEDWPLRLRERLLERTVVIDELRARRLDGRLTHFTAVQDEDGPLWYSAITHFGSWDAALEAADLAPDGPQRRWSRGALLDAIRDRARLGLSVRPGDVGREDPGLYITARKHFGTFQEAMRLAGLPVTPGRYQK